MKPIPENFTEFLYWVKEQTELFWSSNPTTSNNEFVCDDWIFEAKWMGLSEEQIHEVEKEYSLVFTPEHRDFLKILHTIDRKEPLAIGESPETGIPFFYNWLTDEKELNEQMTWPFRTVLEDVLQNDQVWLPSWGKRPASKEKLTAIVENWFKKTPLLIPLTSHRFLVSDLSLNYRPVLSIWGSDMIVYGQHLRTYLLNELQDHLNIKKMVYDQEDDCYYPELTEEVRTIFEKETSFDKNKVIPHWQEMISI